MNELFLHAIWQHRYYRTDLPLQTTQGELILVKHTGMRNADAGPDFLHATMYIARTLWAGHVELHVKTSDWIKHRHDKDPLYQSIILHVVYQHDTDIALACPTLELSPYIQASLQHQYSLLMRKHMHISCGAQLNIVPEIIWRQHLDAVLHQKLHEKHCEIEQCLKQSAYDWNEVAYRCMMRAMGLPVNAEAFELLSTIAPYQLIKKYVHDEIMIHAILFGQAGWLHRATDTDPYIVSLQKTYAYLQSLHQLVPMPLQHWKWLRMRPANFPTLRLAQIASWLYRYKEPALVWLQCTTMQDVDKLLLMPVHVYWQSHYVIGKPCEVKHTSLGADRKRLLYIHAIIPLWWSYGILHTEEARCHTATQWLAGLPPENNAIIRMWKEWGIQPTDAADGQSMLYTYKQYCTYKKCLTCVIGNYLLRQQLTN